MTDMNNCRVDTTFNINISNACEIYIPNIFSPNEDGINDEFRIYSDIPREVERLIIFDRWGNLVFGRRDFRTDDGGFYWNGKIGEENAPEGVYAYLIDFIGDRSIFRIVGDVTIKR
jgi:gliding motility-associated-like protein